MAIEVFRWIIAIFIILSSTGGVVLLARKAGLVRPVITAALLFMAIAITSKFLFGLIGDESTYYAEAIGILNQWQVGQPYISTLGWTKLSVSYLLAIFYYLTIPNAVLGVLLLTPFFCSIPLLIGQASFNFFASTQLRVLSAWTSALLPQMLLWSPLMLREVLSFFLLAAGIYATSLMHRSKLLASSLIFMVTIVLMMFVRVQMTWVLIALFIASSLIEIYELRCKGKRILMTLSACILAVSALFVATQIVSNPTAGGITSSESIITNDDLRELAIKINSRESQSLAVVTNLAEEPNSVHIAVYALRNIAPSLFGPFPWQWKNIGFVAAGLDGLVIFAIVILAIAPILIKRLTGAKVACTLWIGVLPLVLANAIALANYGIAMRVRANIALVLLPIALYSGFQIYQILRSNLAQRHNQSPQGYAHIGE